MDNATVGPDFVFCLTGQNESENMFWIYVIFLALPTTASPISRKRMTMFGCPVTVNMCCHAMVWRAVPEIIQRKPLFDHGDLKNKHMS